MNSGRYSECDGYGEAPWNWNWQPPLEENPSEIAAESHAAVCQATFRVPFFNFVKYAIEQARFLIIYSMVYVMFAITFGRDNKIAPPTQEIYVEVEKVSKHRNPLKRRTD